MWQNSEAESNLWKFAVICERVRSDLRELDMFASTRTRVQVPVVFIYIVQYKFLITEIFILLFNVYPFRISLCQQTDLISFYSFFRTKKLDFTKQVDFKPLFAKKVALVEFFAKKTHN